MAPTICRIVKYRSRTGSYTVPAVVNATVDTLDPRGVEMGHVPPLSSPMHVHLTVFTPGRDGTARPETKDLEPEVGRHLRGNAGGTYQEWDIPYDETGETPGSWSWPPRRGNGRGEPERAPVGVVTAEECVYTDERFPHGLRCMDCDHLFEPGERYSRRLVSMAEFEGEAANVVEVVCVPCGLTGAVQA